MISKKYTFLLALLGSGIFFYQKKSTDSLIIICLFVLFFMLFFANKEHIENTGATPVSTNEAIQNLASMYNSGTLKATNLELTGNLTIGNNLTINKDTIKSNNLELTGNLNIGNNLTINKDTIKSTGRLHIGGDELLYLLNKSGVVIGKEWGGNGNLTIGGNEYIGEKNSLVFANKVGMGFGNDNFITYRADTGHTLYQSNVPGHSFHTNNFNNSVGAWNAYSNAGISKPV